MAVDEWDAKNNTVVYDDSEFNSTSNRMESENHQTKKHIKNIKEHLVLVRKN